MSRDFALDYIDVATRIVEFREKHPEGSLQQVSLSFVVADGKDWVVYTAAAYRTPDDTRPGQGTAWEPIPGMTNFTRGSEVQNAETAAWGRAIVASLAADTKRGIASAEEVRGGAARQEQGPPANPNAPLINEIAALARLLGIAPARIVADWEESHDGQHIKDATDVGSLTLLRDELAARQPEATP